MPITVTYDLKQVSDPNDRTWIRSMFERFGFRRLGGSVFRYAGVPGATGELVEDWLNHVAPALMLFRSFVLKRGLTLERFTVDAQSIAFLDHSDETLLLGTAIQDGATIALVPPTNPQAGEATVRDFVTAATNAAR